MNTTRACVITPNYPDPCFIERGAFVERLVRNWMSEGLAVDVIAPRSVQNVLRTFSGTKYDREQIAGSTIQYPLYLSFSNKKLGPVDFGEWSRSRFISSATGSLGKLESSDFFYGQFLMTGGGAVLQAKKIKRRPAFVDVGESVLVDSFTEHERKKAEEIVRNVDGLICVSRKLADEVKELGAPSEKVVTFPNTVDLNRFYPHDKAKCRKKLGIPPDIPLILFTGHFIHRKGPLRVQAAVERLPFEAKAVFLGRGEQQPAGESVLYAGPVPNRAVPLWLSAADVFVLPTLHEGHCNAINEAMACGVPVISSAIPEVKAQVPGGTGILVDPENIEAITQAIQELLVDEEKRQATGRSAFEYQKKKSKPGRASRILEWIVSRPEIRKTFRE